MKNFTRSLLLMLSAICLLPSELSALTRPDDFNDRYDLREMVVLSRHSIRAPLSGNGSALADLTSHKWTDWSAAPSELTSRGGALETIMGQYFRKYLAQQGLFPENYVPSTDDVNIYANSMQ
ncbi:MAG: glucose-1-phosphatase, partial [Muribaculaceae bacterium]|nr:glucose-1-phosphatase [Muribaculaceae bacterium]